VVYLRGREFRSEDWEFFYIPRGFTEQVIYRGYTQLIHSHHRSLSYALTFPVQPTVGYWNPSPATEDQTVITGERWRALCGQTLLVKVLELMIVPDRSGGAVYTSLVSLHLA
jgi:hypothetical protein